MKSKRQMERDRRRQLCNQLRLQAEILCESHRHEGRQNVVLSRMFNIILDLKGNRLNDTSRQILANHFIDCGYLHEGQVELGGEGNRNALYLDGAFRIDELAKRITWSEARTGETIDQEKT
jgi:hypothetical protein